MQLPGRVFPKFTKSKFEGVSHSYYTSSQDLVSKFRLFETFENFNSRDDLATYLSVYSTQPLTKNEMVDKLIGYLQQMLERKIPMVPYARLAGFDGMRLSRAALGVMIKFSDYLVDTVHLCKDEIDLM
jgi:hypothetical protein